MSKQRLIYISHNCEKWDGNSTMPIVRTKRHNGTHMATVRPELILRHDL